jgi:hypothetical protein
MVASMGYGVRVDDSTMHSREAMAGRCVLHGGTEGVEEQQQSTVQQNQLARSPREVDNR